MKYDDASWHSEGNFPEGQPQEHSGTHIALFHKWCFIKGWAGIFYFDDEQEAVKAVVEGRLLAIDFLFEHCDGKLVDDMLNEAGNTFAERYYGDDGLYLDDYANGFGEQMYVASEQAHDFGKFAAMVDARFTSGILTKKQIKPWWQVW